MSSGLTWSINLIPVNSLRQPPERILNYASQFLTMLSCFIITKQIVLSYLSPLFERRELSQGFSKTVCLPTSALFRILI